MNGGAQPLRPAAVIPGVMGRIRFKWKTDKRAATRYNIGLPGKAAVTHGNLSLTGDTLVPRTKGTWEVTFTPASAANKFPGKFTVVVTAGHETIVEVFYTT